MITRRYRTPKSNKVISVAGLEADTLFPYLSGLEDNEALAWGIEETQSDHYVIHVSTDISYHSLLEQDLLITLIT